MLEPSPTLEPSATPDSERAGQADSIPLHLAYQACEALARRHYENFPVASWLLPVDRRRALAALYAFARIADDVADSERSTSERLARLDQIELDLLSALDGRPPNPVFVALADAVERHRLPAEPLLDLLEAFRADARDATFATWDDLLAYCRGSANTIGRLVLALHGVEDERALLESDAICTALQLTNFWQDLGADLARGRLFLPLEDLARFGIPAAEITDPKHEASVSRLIELECRATAELYDRGRPVLRRVPFRLAIQLRATIDGGSAILQTVHHRGRDVLEHRPTLGRMTKARIAFLACIGYDG